MKKNIVFIGDSHLSWFKRILRRQPAHMRGYECHFYANASTQDVHMGMLELAGSSLVPTGALSEAVSFAHQLSIDLSAADAVVLVGLRSEFPYKLLDDFDYSKGALKQCMVDILDRYCISLELSKKIRKANPKLNLVVITNPLVSTHLKDRRIASVPGIFPSVKLGNIAFWSEDLYFMWRSALDEAFQGLNVSFCHQAPETIADSIFTQAHFAQNSAIDPGIRHMNEAFWKVMLGQLKKLIKLK